MGWGREGNARDSMSPNTSPVEEPLRRMTAGKKFPDDRPEWLNDDNSDCPLLRPVFPARIAPSNINIPQLTKPGNPHPVEQGPSETSQKVPVVKPIPSSTPLTLGKYAVEPPPQGTADPSTPNLFQSLEQLDHDSDTQGQSTPKRSMPSFQAFLAARKQQRELSANAPAVEATALKTMTYQSGLNTNYQDHLINIEQLTTYAKTYPPSWHHVVGLYIQSFRDPSTFQVAPHCWEKDAWKADMLEKNPGSILTWPDPARGSIEQKIMEQLRGSEFKRQAMEAVIVDWSHICQPQEVINVMYIAGWTRRSEYVFGTNWNVMDTIKKMDEGPEKMNLLAKAKRESPLFFKKCMEDEMCGL